MTNKKMADVLKSAAGKPKKPRTEMMEVQLSEGKLSKLKEKHAAREAAKVEYDLAAAEVIGEVKPKYQEHLRTSTYVSTVKVTDGKNEVNVSWKDAYSKIPVDQKDALVELIGEDNFNQLFREVNDITVKPEVVDNPDALAELIEKVGPDLFAKFFNVEQFVKPTKTFTERRYSVLDESTNEKVSSIAKQYAPAIKVVS